MGQTPQKFVSRNSWRIPIRFDRNESYVNHKLSTCQNGYTKMFEKMLLIKNKIVLNQDFKKFKKKIKFKYLIYTGTPDSYFDYKYVNWGGL